MATALRMKGLGLQFLLSTTARMSQVAHGVTETVVQIWMMMVGLMRMMRFPTSRLNGEIPTEMDLVMSGPELMAMIARRFVVIRNTTDSVVLTPMAMVGPTRWSRHYSMTGISRMAPTCSPLTHFGGINLMSFRSRRAVLVAAAVLQQDSVSAH